MNSTQPAFDEENVEGKRTFFLTWKQWQGALIASTVTGGIAAWPSLSISPWISVTVFLAVLTAGHMAFASRYIVPLPHIALLIAALQYVLAGWAGVYFPPLELLQDTVSALPIYLAYAGPVMVAITIGWFFSLARIRSRRPATPAPNPSLLLEFDILIAIGLAAAVFSRTVPNQGSLSFVVVLVAGLRYVGVHGRMIARGAGWGWRLAIVLSAEVLFAVDATMFHPLLLWSVWTFAVWLYAFQPARRVVFASLLAAVVVLPALQEAKWRLRGGIEEEIANPEESDLDSSVGRSAQWLGFVGEGVWRTISLQLTPEFLSDTSARYNQGWLITRVMFFVPAIEPYAEGETIRDAAVAAVLPRIAAADKVKAGGHELMARYAGMELSETTSMNVGYAGEMYANFGLTGGVIACGLYALVLGLGFRACCKRAFNRAIWWSVVPYAFFPAVKAEDDVAFTFNWTVKGFIILAVVIFLLPNLRRALFGHLPVVARPERTGNTEVPASVASS